MDLRADLTRTDWLLAPFITPVLAPLSPAATMAGVFRYMNIVSAGSAQTDRADGVEATVTQVTHDDIAYTCTEKINHQYIDERYLGYYGTMDKAEVAIAKSALPVIAHAVEAETAVGILDSTAITSADATPSSTTLAAQIDAAVQALALVPGVTKIALVASQYVYNTYILANTSVQDRLAKPANVIFNAPNANFMDAKMQVLAGEFGLNGGVILGNNTDWYTAVTAKNYLLIVAIPQSYDVLSEPQLGTTIVYDVPNFGTAPVVGTYNSDERHAQAVDCWARTDFVLLNSDLARKIKLA